MKKINLLLVYTFLIFSFSFSQQKSIKFNAYGIENGLSQSHVTSFVQDQFGYVWIATQDGLNRFNGYEFDILKHQLNDTNSLPNNYIHCLTQDFKGKIWFGTNRGIGSVDPVTQKIIKINRTNYPKLKGYIFTNIAFDSYGQLWALSEKHGINVINLETRNIEIISSVNGYYDFSSIYVDRNEMLWIGTKSGKIFHSVSPYKTFIEITSDEIYLKNKINSFYQGDSSTVYVCTESGVYDINEKHEINYLSDFPELKYQNVSSIYVENKSKIWIGSNDFGLYLLNHNRTINQTLFHYTKNPYNQSSIVDDHITNLFGDNSGCIWVATEKGISKFDKYKQGFTTITIGNDPDKGLIDYTVWSFNEDSLSNIYIGTKKGLTVYNPYRNKFSHIKRSGLGQFNLLSIYVENPKKIWCGFVDGLYLLTLDSYDNYKFEKIEFMDSDNNSKIRVYQIVKADENRLWIGSKAGLSIINKDDFSYEFYNHSDDEKSLGDGSVKVIYRDLSGKIWLVTSNQGLYNIIERNDNTFYFKHYMIKGYDETNGHITSMVQTEKGFLWLGTYGEGIKRLNLKTNKTKNYTELDGLSNNVVYGLLIDDLKNLWISTNKGLSKFNIEKEKFTNYTTKDGLQSNEFNTNAYFKSANNDLYFGGINGYTKFKSEDIKINPKAPSVVISDITIYSKENNNIQTQIISSNILDSSSLKLPYFQNDLSFEFFSNHYSNPEKNSFKIMLKGYDEEFIYLNENKYHYMNLPDGYYTFIVYGRNPDGIWSENQTVVQIEITPPFWLTWWFRILSILMITLAAFYIYRVRIDRIRRQKIRLELEVVKRTRKISDQNKQIREQNKQVELQKAKIEHQKELLQKEKEKVEGILLNVLPEGTATDLINSGKSKARYYKRVSVMFTDFVGFSKIAEGMNPQDLVHQLDQYFTMFDEIIGKFDIEKIKTIGDSYMCAGGVPIRNKSNAVEIVLASLEIQEHMRLNEMKLSNEGKDCWKIRIGINTGEVTAGVIGQKKFAYDIWGSTVNQAQRMEMYGEAGEVNVSGNTYEIIAPYFDCTYRGKIEAKHNGMLDMYFVNGIKPGLSIDDEGREPNKKFWKIVDLHLYSSINYMKAERHIIKILEDELSPNLHYHSINHTKDVTSAAERLALMEGITDEDLFLLKSAATYHDAGFVEQYDANEEIGMRMAREILPKYGYSQDQIDIIDGLIKSTEIPQSPNTLLQQIMCDADLDYLGRDDFHDIASLLRRELREHGKIDSDKLWDEIQVKFLTAHTYFTKSAIDTRQDKKMKHLEEIKEKLKTYKYKD
jgi:ligand-binding sensor domain-containing protein/class 3 adenylate cyclase/predicted metal-dependent HD superfamily phosphohydrolase